ncbi:CaiB/BaiF CoA transferase family protein [Amycolatopsis pithecellobii]|uniref:CoA transferase n=1 Tax=Amycolatopsis pithecellobii TaxID=664692 RepID=A0A6N7Z7U1_9PSEU|nr:CoA transferase [Amycolatopsis pithecellobii]MTD57424.1 CoA transferase [Amycolatopsis pithecellobii]
MPPEPTVRTEHGPLTGIRVIELGSVVAGPFATRLLADYGADVIKVEAPDRPDPLRTWGQEAYRDHHLWWTVQARNKRCITLDLRSPDGQNLFLELARMADVVVENFRPGTMEKWNLGYPTLSGVNKGLVLVRVSGFGQTGPYSERPGYASVAEAMGGLRAINGYPGQAPPRMAISLGDSLGGLFAALGAVTALQHRSRTGLGQVVDVSLAESCLALTESMIPEFDRLGRIRRPSGTRLDGIAPSNLFKTADGVWIIVAANQDTVFRRLCRAMARPELADDPRFATHVDRGRNQDLVEGIVAEWVAGHDAATVQRLLDDADVVAGPLWTAEEIVSDPHFRAREMLVPHYDERVGENVLGPGVVPKFSASPGSVRWAGPAEPGYHNAEVFSEILASTPEGVDQKECH